MNSFDRHGDTYGEDVARAVGRLGDPAFFTEVKARVLEETARRLIGPCETLSALDVGCGPGLTDGYLAGAFDRLTGVDVSEPMIARARDANPTVRYEHYDGARLPFDSAVFDLSFAVCVLHHVAPGDRSPLVAEIARVTRPGGLVVVLEHNPLNPLTRLVVSRCEFDEGVTLLSMRKTRQLLAGSRLDPVESNYLFFFPWRARAFRVADRALGPVPFGAQYVVVARRM